MTTNTAMPVPAHIAARVAARAGQKSAVLSALLTDTFQYPKISTRASRYRLVEDGVETVVGTTLDVVIVGSNPGVSKIWYSKPYDGADAVRPDCFSNDGVAPDPSGTQLAYRQPPLSIAGRGKRPLEGSRRGKCPTG